MSNNFKILGVIVLLVAIGASGWFWYTASQSRNNTDLTQNNAEIENDKRQEEKQVVKENSQKQGEEKVEDARNIKPKFGIDDSGLKYNQDGSVNTNGWETFEHLDEKYLLPPGWSVVETNGPNGSMEITNLSNIEAFKTELGIDVNIDGKVNIGIAGAPVDFGGTYEIDAKVKKLLKENVDILLKEAAEQELQNPLFSRCNNGMTRRGESCEELTKPKCTYDEKKKGKYMIIGCIYNRKETDEDMYILNKTIFFANKSGITEYSVYTETKERKLIDKNRNIHSIIMDQVIENIVK